MCCKTLSVTAVIWTILAAPRAGFAEDTPLQRLDRSPRHSEWVTVNRDDRIIHAFVVFPEVERKSLAVLLIHENRGLTDWVRGLADQIAEAGYIAIAPDLLSGMGPEGGKTADFESSSAARDALYELPPEQIAADLDAVLGHARNLDAASGRIVAAGFCWGGRQTFALAARRPDLSAAFVFYGSAPDSAAIAAINCPVYGFYGGNDARITSAVPSVGAMMKAAGKIYEPVTYYEARHAFMRRGEESDSDADPNRIARDAAWQRWIRLLGDMDSE